MKKDFDPATKDKAAGMARVLLMDGHSSHYTYELLEYAQANNITILGYPPHCTHVLQGLDVVCFAKMKAEFHWEICTFEDSNKYSMSKSDFTGVFGRAFLRAFTKDAVEAAFRATGVFPFNPNVIPEKAMKPSLPTSTKASFPLPQTSPVRAIIAAMGAHPPTAFDIEAGADTPHPALSTPLTSHRTHNRPADPTLHTPSKRLWLLYSGLSATESGSCLVAKTRITSASKVPHLVFEGLLPELPKVDWLMLDNPLSAPVLYETWESLKEQVNTLTENLQRARAIIHTYEAIEEGWEAQMLIQHLFLTKQQEALQAKEKRKVDDRTRLPKDGLGRHLTDPELIESIRKAEEARRVKENNKRQRDVARKACGTARRALEHKWKAVVAGHEWAVAGWVAERAHQKAAGVHVKDLPKRPARPLKPQLTVSEPSGETGARRESDLSLDSNASDKERA